MITNDQMYEILNEEKLNNIVAKAIIKLKESIIYFHNKNVSKFNVNDYLNLISNYMTQIVLNVITEEFEYVDGLLDKNDVDKFKKFFISHTVEAIEKLFLQNECCK